MRTALIVGGSALIVIGVLLLIALLKGNRQVDAILAQAEAEKGTDADLLTIARAVGVEPGQRMGDLADRVQAEGVVHAYGYEWHWGGQYPEEGR